MMKNYLSLLIFFFCAFYFKTSAQTKKDTFKLHKDEIDCNIVWKKNKEVYSEFKKEEKRINYKSLGKKIINDINLKNIPSKNVVFKLYIKQGYYASSFTFCAPSLNIKNPNYNYLDFYTQNNIKRLQKKLKKNLYFDFYDSKFEINEYHPLNEETKNHSFYKYLATLKAADKTICYDSDYAVYEPVTLDKAGYVQIEFRNKLSGIVIVKYDYFIYDQFSPIVFKTYQYQNRKWVEIPTVEEYKF